MEFNKETGIAFARLIVTFAVCVAAVFGWTLDYELWLNIVISAIAIICMVRGLWWKNNNLTKAAQEMQKELDEMKLGAVDSTVGGTD